jgi:hypothetical protein
MCIRKVCFMWEALCAETFFPAHLPFPYLEILSFELEFLAFLFAAFLTQHLITLFSGFAHKILSFLCSSFRG